MSPAQHLTWDNFRTTVLVLGEQRVHRVSKSPLIEIFGDGGGRIGAWIEVPPETIVPERLLRLAFLNAAMVAHEDGRALELSTASRSLHRQFYHFATAVAERVLSGAHSTVDAVVSEIECFAELLEPKSLLGIERQLGLLGELIFLERLVARRGVAALDAWIGIDGEPHDFRVGLTEFEIKTTVRTQRIHTINGSEQLIPSTNCSLYLVSIQVGPAGAAGGFSLSEMVRSLGSTFLSETARLDQFYDALSKCGLHVSELDHYGRPFVFRQPMALVPIDESFPAITRSIILGALGAGAVRVEALSYDVNVEGLEWIDGTREFAAVMNL